MVVLIYANSIRLLLLFCCCCCCRLFYTIYCVERAHRSECALCVVHLEHFSQVFSLCFFLSLHFWWVLLSFSLFANRTDLLSVLVWFLSVLLVGRVIFITNRTDLGLVLFVCSLSLSIFSSKNGVAQIALIWLFSFLNAHNAQLRCKRWTGECWT